MNDDRRNGLSTKELLYHIWGDLKALRENLGRIEERVDSLEKTRDQSYWPRKLLAGFALAFVAALASGAVVALKIG